MIKAVIVQERQGLDLRDNQILFPGTVEFREHGGRDLA